MSEAIPSAVLDEAIAWSVKLNFNKPDAATFAAFDRWRKAAVLHERAWSRLQALNADFTTVPQNLALDALNLLDQARGQRRRQRRAILKSMALGGGMLAMGWAVREQTPWQRVLADASTGVGQREHMTLGDGSQLVLNTDTAVAVQMHGAERVLVLYRGEISVQTGPDPGFASKRPFFVRTPYGAVQALGTRFIVRLDEDSARISVQQDAVELRPASGAAPGIAQAGQEWRLDSRHARRLAAPAMAPDAWLQGAVAGKNMRLADLLAELSRYRHGRISCAPEVAGLRVSGTYHVNDIDQSLRFLAQTLPVRLRYWTPYWVTVGPA